MLRILFLSRTKRHLTLVHAISRTNASFAPSRPLRGTEKGHEAQFAPCPS